MKKKFLGILFILLFLSAYISAQSSTIRYYAFCARGIVENGYHKYDIESRNHIIDQIRDKLNVHLLIETQKLIDESGIKTEELFFDKFDKALYSSTPMDLIYLPDHPEKLQELIDKNQLLPVDDFIRENAPNLYAMYPKKFWEYRERVGDVYSIPVRRYPNLTEAGFWTFRGHKVDAESLVETLLEVGIENAAQPFIGQVGVNSALKSFLSIYDLVSVGRGELLVNLDQSTLYPLSDMNFQFLKMMQTYGDYLHRGFKFSPSLAGAKNFQSFKWTALYTALNSSLLELTNIQIQKITELFSNPNNTFLSEIQFNPFGYYRKLYIPAKSENTVVTLNMIDNFVSSPYWYGLFTYGRDITPLHIKDDEMKEIKTFFNFNKSRMKSLFLPFCNEIYHRIPEYFPEPVKNDFINVKEKLRNNDHPLNGFDIDQAYEQTREEVNHKLSIVRYLDLMVNGPESDTAKALNKTQLLIKNLQKQIDDYLGM